MRDKAMKKAKYAREVPHSSGGAGLAESAGWRTGVKNVGKAGLVWYRGLERGRIERAG